VAGSISTSTSNNPLIPQFNIGGLASGLDTNSIIQSIMAVAQQPQQAIINQQTLEKTRQTDLQAIQSQVTTLQLAISQLMSPSTWTAQQQISSSDPSHITATGTNVPPGGFELTVQRLARAAQMTQTSAISTASADDQLQIQVGGGTTYNVDVASGDSLSTIASKINNQTGTALFASVVSGKLVLSSQTTGAANTISVTSTGSLAGDLGLSQTVTPRDAQFTVDGGAVQTSASNVVTTVASGLSLTLLGTTSSPVSVVVNTPGPNVAGVETAIQGFVTTYNQTVDMVNAKLNEQKVANPQTDADRAAGDLQGDPTLTSLLGSLRQAVSNIFTNGPAGFNAMSAIGLSTGAAVGTGTVTQASLNGDLTLDTTALETALNTNYTAVKQMFSNVTNNYGTEGMVQRLNGVMSGYIGTGGILNSSIAGETSLINELGDQKAMWDVRLNDKQAALRQQYTNMETALSQAQSQGSWLTSQIASLTNSKTSSSG
jgi:flagellar hook-associated protein 2